MKTRLIICVMIITIAGSFAGCSNAQKYGTGGAAVGAGLGAIIGNQHKGRSGEGAVIGAAAGGILGYMIGNEKDKEEAQQNRRWVEGHYEMRSEQRWVPGYWETVWVPALYEERLDENGNKVKVLVHEGYNEKVYRDGHYVQEQVKVWVPGHWE